MFACGDDTDVELSAHLEWSEVRLNEASRKQLRILVGSQMGKVLEVKFQHVPRTGDLESLFTLKGADTERFVDLVKSLDYLAVDADSNSVRVSSDTVRRVLTDPTSIRTVYEQDPATVAALISNDVSAPEVIAVAKRKHQVAIFREMLQDPEFFAQRQEQAGARGPEDVWQKFFEDNPWILGVGLSGKLLTSWDPNKLEQLVVAASVTSAGKRTDAMMRTVGAVSSMVFAEIKHHETPLLQQVRHSYRTASWAPSRELSGGITQIQQTVYLAREHIKERAMQRDEGGVETGDVTWLIRPRCYLIAGNLKEVAPSARGIDPDSSDRSNSFAPTFTSLKSSPSTRSWRAPSGTWRRRSARHLAATTNAHIAWVGVPQNFGVAAG